MRTGGEKAPSHRPGSGVFFDALAKIEIVASDIPHTTARYRLAPPRSLVVQVRHDEKESFVQERGPVERNWPSKVRTVIRIVREETVSKLIACRALEKSEIAVQSYFDPIVAADSDGVRPRAAITALLHVLCPKCFLNATRSRNVFLTQAFAMAWTRDFLSALTPAFLLCFS